MPSVDYWFKHCDRAPSPPVEWLRRSGIAIGAVENAMGYEGASHEVVEVWVGTVNGHPRFRRQGTVEAIQFRNERWADAIEQALRALRSPQWRRLCVTRDDPIAAVRLVPYGFIHRGCFVRLYWHGPGNEDAIAQGARVPVLCTADDAEDELLGECFGDADAASRLSAFVEAGHAKRGWYWPLP